MNKLIFYIVLAGCISVLWQGKMQAQTHNNNLHETVTHRQGGSGKVESTRTRTTTADPTFNRLSQEKNMPQHNNEFGYWTGAVTIFKYYIGESLPRGESHGLLHGIKISSYDWKTWSKSDLRALANAYNGVEVFEMLEGIKIAAGAKHPTDKLTAKDIEDAQRALENLKPNSCADWKEFGKWIHSVAKETETERAAIKERKKQRPHPTGGTGLVPEPEDMKQGVLLDLEKFRDIAGNPMETLDQQTALRLLEQNAVTMDTTHDLKSPDPKAIALDAVKNIKGAVRAA